MIKTRKIDKILKSKPTIEGAGVHLQRVFGYNEVPLFDPFLLLDDFHSNNPQDYIAGFPWHPHRGIETVTYMIHGVVEHGDSIGNKGIIDNPSDVGGWPTLNSTTAPADSDHDGMPDAWETQKGLNPNDASDGNKVAADGYTMLEKYLNSIN